MTFLVRRGIQAFAGFTDLDANHYRPAQNPLAAPWALWNQSQSAELIDDGTTNHINFDGVGTSIFNPGGFSYSYQPFTPYWGIDFDWAGTLSNTLQAQVFWMFVTFPWVYQKSATQSLELSIFFNSPLLTGGQYERIMIKTIDSSGNETTYAQNDLPGGTGFFSGSYHTFSIWFDNDNTIRIWIDGQLYIFYSLPPALSAFKPGPGSRTLNFANHLYNPVQMRNYKVYDRFYDLNWSSALFTDTFNRADGAVGNGWTVFGTAGQIVSNSYSITGTADFSQAIQRDSGLTGGRRRIQGTVGGNLGPSSSNDQGLQLCGNSAGTSGLSANIYSTAVYLSTYSSALTGNTPTFTDFSSNTSLSSAIVSGDVIGFNVDSVKQIAWIDRTPAGSTEAEVLLFAGGVHATVPATNSQVGCRVSRKNFGNSGSWNDVSYMQAA